MKAERSKQVQGKGSERWNSYLLYIKDSSFISLTSMCLVLFTFLRGESSQTSGGEKGSAAMREKERQQLLAEIDEKKRKILREVEVRETCCKS